MAKKHTVQQSAGRLVMAVFHKHKAYDESKAISIDKFKNVALSSEMIGYTFGNLLQEGVLHKTEADTFYFDQKQWNKIERRVNRVYWVMLLAPIVALLFL